jgi:hypothetical protein
MNVIISPSVLVRLFHNGDDQDALNGFRIGGLARLESRSGYDGPSFDDDSGPSVEAKQYAKTARVPASLHFVRATMWQDRVKSVARCADDFDPMAKASAFALYLPHDQKLVRHYGAPDHDELACWVKVRDEGVPDLVSWLGRSASYPSSLPETTLHGLYFHRASPIIHRLPGPRWDDFLNAKRAGTFDSYSIAFEAKRRS